MKVIDSFIEAYNSYLAVKTHYYVDVQYILRCEKNCDCEDELKCFQTCFIFPVDYQYAGFYVSKNPVMVPEPFVSFASHVDYSLEYVLNRETGWVSLYSLETAQQEMYCAASVTYFFKSMTTVIEVKNKLIGHAIEFGNYDLDQGYIQKAFQVCMALNRHNKDFQEFYLHILNVEDET